MRSEHPHTRPVRLGSALLGLVALCATGCQQEPEDLTHGYIKVQFARSEAAAESPYIGTAQVQITMTYDACFTNFYDANPNWTQEGVEGGPVFGTLEDGGEGWRDRLCDPLDAGQLRCEVVDIRQVLDVADQLTVTYAVSDDPENRFVKFGPLPLVEEIPEFDCAGGSPRMQIDPRSMRGLNGGGQVIWQGEALDDDMARPGQGKSIVVKSSRND